MATTTEKVKLVPGTGSTPYIVDNVNGYVGGILVTYDSGDKTLYTIEIGDKIDYKGRNSSHILLGFQYTAVIDQWTNFIPKLYTNQNVIKVDDSDYVNDVTGLPCESTDPGAITTYQFWFNNIGLTIIDAIQNSIITKL